MAAAPGRYLPQAAKETTGTSLGLGDGRTQEGVVVPMPYRVRLAGARPRDLVAEEHAAMTRSLFRHPNGGGLVEHRDNLDVTAWVGPNARVLGNAQVRGRARIEDFALVQDEAVVRGRAVVRGHAWVTEQSVVEDEARVEDFAILQKNAHLSGRSRAGEGVLVDAAASDLAMMEGLGNAGGRLRGNVFTDGPLTWGKLNYGHGVVLFPGVAQAEYPNTRGLYINYDTEQEHPIFLLDGHGVNHGIKEGEVSTVMDTQIDSRVLSFDGKNDFVRIPARAADFIDSTWRLRVKRDGAARATLLEFAGTTEDGRRTQMRLDTDLRLLLASGSDQQTIASRTPLPIGRWCAVEVDFNGDEATIRLDGQVVARGAMKPNPEDVRAEAASLWTRRDRSSFNHKTPQPFSIGKQKVLFGTAPARTATAGSDEPPLRPGPMRRSPAPPWNSCPTRTNNTTTPPMRLR